MRGNPFGPPDPEGDASLGVAFGGGDPAPVPAARSDASPAAPAASDAFEHSTTSYDQMFDHAAATPSLPAVPASSPPPVPVTPVPVTPAAVTPAAVPKPAPAPPTPAPVTQEAHPPRTRQTETAPPSPPFAMVSPPPPVRARVPATSASPFGDAGDADGFSSRTRIPRGAPKAAFDPSKSPPRSPNSASDAPETLAPDDGEETRRAVADDSRVARAADEGAHLSGKMRTFAWNDRGAAADEPFETDATFDRDDVPGTSSVEALAFHASRAADSARKLERRVQELDAECEACRLEASGLRRELEARTSAVRGLEAELRRVRDLSGTLELRQGGAREGEGAALPEDRVSAADELRRSRERLEKATSALVRERAVSAEVTKAARAATARAEEAERLAAEKSLLAESIEERNRNAESELAALRVRAMHAEASLAAMAHARSVDGLGDGEEASGTFLAEDETGFAESRATAPSASRDPSSPAIVLRLTIASDAEALRAREVEAARACEEAARHREAATRVVQKLVEENGALMEKLDGGGFFSGAKTKTKTKTETEKGSPSPRGVADAASPSRERAVDLPSRAIDERISEGASRRPAAPASPSGFADPRTDREPPKPRGLWAFITGADKAPSIYVPKRFASETEER